MSFQKSQKCQCYDSKTSQSMPAPECICVSKSLPKIVLYHDVGRYSYMIEVGHPLHPEYRLHISTKTKDPCRCSIIVSYYIICSLAFAGALNEVSDILYTIVPVDEINEDCPLLAL